MHTDGAVNATVGAQPRRRRHPQDEYDDQGLGAELPPMHFTRADPDSCWFVDPVPAPGGQILPAAGCVALLEGMGVPMADGRQSQYPAIAMPGFASSAVVGVEPREVWARMCRNLATSHARAGRGVEAKHWAFVSAFL